MNVIARPWKQSTKYHWYREPTDNKDYYIAVVTSFKGLYYCTIHPNLTCAFSARSLELIKLQCDVEIKRLYPNIILLDDRQELLL